LANAAENLASDGGRVRIFAYKSMRSCFAPDVTETSDSLSSDLAAAHAMMFAELAARLRSEARADRAEST
jgi:hypothetical protein